MNCVRYYLCLRVIVPSIVIAISQSCCSLVVRLSCWALSSMRHNSSTIHCTSVRNWVGKIYQKEKQGNVCNVSCCYSNPEFRPRSTFLFSLDSFVCFRNTIHLEEVLIINDDFGVVVPAVVACDACMHMPASSLVSPVFRFGFLLPTLLANFPGFGLLL